MPTRVTSLLVRWRQGDETALDRLMPLVYDELHRIARAILSRERPGHTLQPTALVNEACVKLLDGAELEFTDRSHFLAMMSRAMRHILVDHARAAAAAKRGGREQRVPWDTNIEVHADGRSAQFQMLELDRALDALGSESPPLARIIEMHYFSGLTAAEVAAVVGRSAEAVRHDIRLARAWLRRELSR